jgi:cell division septation protein DedD
MGNGRRNGERVLGSGHLIGFFLGVVLLCCVFYTLGYVMGRSQEASTVRAAAVDDSGTMTSPVSSPAGSIVASGNAGDQPAAAAATTDNPSGPSAASASDNEWNSLSKKTAEGPVERSAPPLPAVSMPANSHGAAVKEAGPPAGPDENLNNPSPTAPPITATPATMIRTPPPSVAAESTGRVTLPPNYQPPRIPHGAVLLQVAAVTSESDALALASVLHKKQFPAFVLTPTTDQFYRVQVGPYSDAHAAKAVHTMLDEAGFKSIIKR